MHDLIWTSGAYVAEFRSPDELARAARAFTQKGYTRIETYSPVPIVGGVNHGASRLPIVVFVVGLLGGAISYAIQWYANAYAYPMDIAGRPAHAVPAFLIPAFEGTVLSAALAAFVGFFVITRLPEPWHPLFELDGFDRTTVDRYWLAVDATDHRSSLDLTPHELTAAGAIRVMHLEARQ